MRTSYRNYVSPPERWDKYISPTEIFGQVYIAGTHFRGKIPSIKILFAGKPRTLADEFAQQV